MALASVGNVLQTQRNYGTETQHLCDMEVNHKGCVQKYFLFDAVLKYHRFLQMVFSLNVSHLHPFQQN